MRRPFLLSLLTTALVVALPLQAQDLDATTRAALEAAAVEALQSHYIFPDRVKDLRARLAAERARLDAAADAPAYAQALGGLLGEVTRDRHVRVVHSPQALPAEVAVSAPSPDAQRQLYRMLNQGVSKVERLPGNLGYLDLRAFTSRDTAKPKLDAALTLLADTEALIIDLRHNGGGQPETVAYLASFFVKPGTHLTDMVWRTPQGEEVQSFYAEAVGLQYDKPVWLLMSPRSFSGAEGFAYELQQLKRAQVAGQASGGGAHPGGMHRIGTHFSLFVPNGRARNPHSGTNWEGVGVQPDLPVPAADDALRVVQLRLLDELAPKARDPRQLRGLEARMKELRETAPKPLP